jgi:hypothetical protein
MSTPVRWLASLEDFYSWGSQTNSFAPKFINLAQSAKDSWRDQYEHELRRYLPEVKTVSQDKREAVTITSVKMVGGVAPEAELMRQAVAQLEGMGFRVEHPKAASDMGNPISQAQAEEETPEHEKCPYCGITCESPCESPPPGPCEQACNAFYGSDPTKP